MTMRTPSLLILAAVLWIATFEAAQAVSPTPDEMSETRRWLAAKLEGVQKPVKVEVGLVVLANNDPVQKNARGGRSPSATSAITTR